MATKTTSTSTSSSTSSTSDPVLGPLLRAERFHHFYHIQQHLPFLRPKFCIRRPNNQMVPLIAMDELPHWLLVITNYPLAFSDMELVAPNRQVPRLGEYDIICLFCESSLHHVADDISWHRSKMRDLDQYQDALLGRRYPPYVYPSSYYEDARSLHHYEAFAATTASDSQCSGGSTLNPEASEFRPGSNRIRSDDARSAAREIQMILERPLYRPLYVVQDDIRRPNFARPELNIPGFIPDPPMVDLLNNLRENLRLLNRSPQPRMGIPYR